MTSGSDICAVALEPWPLVKTRLLMGVSCMDLKHSRPAGAPIVLADDGKPCLPRSREAYRALVLRASDAGGRCASDITPVPEENHRRDGECFDLLACLPDPIWLVSAASYPELTLPYRPRVRNGTLVSRHP